MTIAIFCDLAAAVMGSNYCASGDAFGGLDESFLDYHEFHKLTLAAVVEIRIEIYRNDDLALLRAFG